MGQVRRQVKADTGIKERTKKNEVEKKGNRGEKTEEDIQKTGDRYKRKGDRRLNVERRKTLLANMRKRTKQTAEVVNGKGSRASQELWSIQLRISGQRRKDGDMAALYESGIIPGRPKLQQEATAADKVVDDFLKGRIRV